jgi:hypothetical protein
MTLLDAADALMRELDRSGFDDYAILKEKKNRVFGKYTRFREYLSAVASLRCAGPCSLGGGKTDCAIRSCAQEKGFRGCWECVSFETCRHLEHFEAFHGRTPRDNLTLIKEYGVDRWADHRGPHYLWSKRP